MKVVGVDIALALGQTHADAKADIAAWLAEARTADWKTPHDVQARYPKASILKGGRVVFNIRGNRYRLLVQIDYVRGIILVLRAGTHADYDTWNV